MKRTLLITLEYPPQVGGVSAYYGNLVQQLPAEKIAVLDNREGALLRPSRGLIPRWFRAVRATRQAVRQHQSEQILVGQILPLGTVAWLLKLFFRIPYSVMTHAMDLTVPFGPAGSRRKQWLIRRIIRSADQITTVSEFSRQRLLQIGARTERVSLIHPCPNVNGTTMTVHADRLKQLASQYGLADKRILLSVGRLVERKGFDTLIRVLKKLRQGFPDLQLVIVGEGPDRERLEALADEQGIGDIVHVIRGADNTALAAWYTLAEIFVLPARQLPNLDVEGFGIVFVEASSFGKPVIGGRSGGIPDAIADGETGLLVDPENTSSLEQALNTLLHDPARAKQMGARGKTRVEAEFRWEAQARKLEELLSR